MDSIIQKPTGAEAVVLIILFFVTTALSLLYTTATNPAAASGAQRYIFLIFPVMFAPFIAGQAAGLAVYWIATNVWSLGQQMVVQKVIPAPAPPSRSRREGDQGAAAPAAQEEEAQVALSLGPAGQAGGRAAED